MSKNIVKKTERPLSDKPNIDRSRSSYPPQQTDVEEQPGRPKQPAAGTVDSLKGTARAVRVEFSPTAPKVAAKPPQSSQPNSLSSPPETNLTQRPVAQKSPSTAPAPKPPAVPATPSSKTVQPAAPPTQAGKPAVLAQPQSTTAPRTINVNFILPRSNAKQVWLCADFNGWSRNTNPMKRRNDGQWETTVALLPGFPVDGDWIVHPAAKQSVANAFGTLNSVLEVRA